VLAYDVIERLIDFAGADFGGDKAMRDARRALQDAVREFPGLHRWNYGYTWHRLNLNPLYNTGTVAYDATTRALTLTGGTWPPWAASGNLRIADVVYAVDSRDSNTQLTLDATLSPVVNLASGTAYTLYQDTYELPADFLASDRMCAEINRFTLEYVHPTSILFATRSVDNAGTPIYYTIIPSPLTPERLAARVYPYPDAAQTLDFIYQRRLRRLRYDVVESGRVTVANGSKSVTGTETTFRSDMAGAVIRFSRDATRPTSVEGGNAAAFESRIASVASATSLTLVDAAIEDFTGVAYVISDPLDIEEGTMANCLCWQAIRHQAATTRMKDRAAIDGEASAALVRAKEDDARNFSLQTAGPGYVRRLRRRHMPSGPDE
jgi:hypothetical protein